MSHSNRPEQNLTNRRFSRRRMLRGLGAAVALPAFESLLPRTAWADAAPAAGPCRRLGVVYFPNGAIPAAWRATGEGANFTLGSTMSALQPLQHQLQVFNGLNQVNAMAGPDGAGDHARASGSFLTSVRVRKTAGADIHAGVSIDQVVANQLGDKTRFPSLELSCEDTHKSGDCDSGYSCTYVYNLAWQSPVTPVTPEANPRLAFERLFGEGAPGQRRAALRLRQQQQQSILDFVMEDAQELDRQLASRDRQKLDEYLTSVREIEQRIQNAEKFRATPDPNVPTPSGVPEKYQEHISLMFSLMHLAFQTDSTRVATFLMAHEGSNRAFPEIDIPEGHHFLSHHDGNQDMIAKVAKIDLFYMQEFAAFLQKMEQTRDIDGNSLLHNSMIIYGSGNSDGNLHTHVDLPIILAGSGGGTLTPGRHVNFGGVPLANLYLSLADRLGVKGVDRFGDSTGRLTNI